jgi:alanine racemase
MAGWANTIPHEILTNINTRVPRVYIDAEAAPG